MVFSKKILLLTKQVHFSSSSLDQTFLGQTKLVCSGIGLFCSTMHKWGLVLSANCRCRAEEQTANHILASYPLYHPPNGTFGLAALNDDTVDGLKRTVLNI